MHSWKCYIDICTIQVYYYYCHDNDDDYADDYKTKKHRKSNILFFVGLELPSYHVESKCHGRQEI